MNQEPVDVKMRRWGIPLCAKLIDYGLVFLLGGIVALSLPCYLDVYVYFLFALSVPLLWVPFEALLLSTWGTTVGHKMCGYTFCGNAGEKPSFKEGLRQAFGMGRLQAIRTQTLSLWRIVSAACVAVGCFLGGTFAMKIAEFTLGIERSASTEGWVQYSSLEKGFTVAFPTDPKLEENKTLEIPSQSKTLNYSEVISETRKAQYSVSYMELPRKWRLASNTTLLKGVLDAMVKHVPDTTLLEKNFVKHGDHRALDFHLRQGEDEVRGRLIIIKGTLYKLTIVYPPSIAGDLKHETFLDSFDTATTNSERG
jgi:hypothetical protein